MKNLTKSLILGFILALMHLPPLHAQTEGSTSADTRPSAASPTTPGQAPDEVMKKLSDLVHAGRYAEAQQLTAGLSLAYPDDQRLIKAKVLLDKSLAAASAKAIPNADPSASDSVPTPATGTSATQLTGMDKVDYNALIVLARQAQQNTDLEQQKATLKQFMDQSTSFLRKHPDQMLLWKLRVASAISLNDPIAGYEAGQKLLAAGAADSNDPSLQELLAELRNKGWLDKQKAEDYKNYGGVLGTWRISWSTGDRPNEKGGNSESSKEVFVKSETGGIEGHFLRPNGQTDKRPEYKGTILDSGEIRWNHYLPTSDHDPERPAGGYNFLVNEAPGKQRYPSGWQPPISYVLSDDKRTMTMVFPQQSPANRKDGIKYGSEHPVTLVFEKVSDSQSY